jgi:transcriptional regulator with XRE-family HTH domain
MTDRERIGQRIAALRKERGLSQQELAEMTGLKQQSVARIETGRFSTGIDILGNIADALGGSVEIIETSTEVAKGS